MEKKKILIAINNDFTRDVFSKNFIGGDFEITTASNGKEALLKSKEIIPDIIIADVSLNEINGFELTELLKKEETTKRIPILIYSRSGSSEHRKKAINLEAKDFINGLSDSPKQAVLRVNVHLGKQKSYLIEPSKSSLKKTKELADDIEKNLKCSSCGNNKSIYLMRNLNAGENDFKLSFVCLNCS